MKKYKGEMYAFNPDTLGVPRTKDNSTLAANAWWEAKQRELDAKNRVEHGQTEKLLIETLGTHNLGDLTKLVEQGEAARKLLAVIQRAADLQGEVIPGKPVVGPQTATSHDGRQHIGFPSSFPDLGIHITTPTPTAVADQIRHLEPGQRIQAEAIDAAADRPLGEAERVETLANIARQLGRKPVEIVRTARHQSEQFLGLLRTQVGLPNGISAGRWGAYQRDMVQFLNWYDPERDVADINEDVYEAYYLHLNTRYTERSLAIDSCKNRWNTFLQFVSRLAERRLIPLPGNFKSKRLRFRQGSAKKIKVFAKDEVRKLVSACDGYSERTRLYILLMLNCGMYQSDISDLTTDEVDLKSGTITRQRSKRKGKDGEVMTVTYPLWPETLALLKQERAKVRITLVGDDGRPVEGAYHFLLSDENKPLCRLWMEGGKMRRYDLVQSAWSRLCDKAGVKYPLKRFRKTGASILEQHSEYRRYTLHYLAQSPKSVAERSYIIPDEKTFREMLLWLRDQFFGESAKEQ